MPHQVERWDAGTQTAVIWIKVDTVKGNTPNQRLRMHWGKAGAADGSDGKAVFATANGFQGVWHLGATLEDATANGNNGTDSGSAPAPQGSIGAGRSFNNPDATVKAGLYILIGSPASLNIAGKITMEAWVKWNANAITRYFHGSLDEVRVSNVARSVEWIKLNYENQKTGQMLVTFGKSSTSLAGDRAKAKPLNAKAIGRESGGRFRWILPGGNGEAEPQSLDVQGRILPLGPSEPKGK